VLWLNHDTDVLCSVERVRSWDCTSFEFDFDGLTPDEARAAAEMLFAAQRRAAHPTALWLVDFVGVGREHGAAHRWDGTQAPGWPPPT
jgi:hypothetical protein